MRSEAPLWDRMVFDGSSDRRRFPIVIAIVLWCAQLVLLPNELNLVAILGSFVLLVGLAIAALGIENQWFPKSDIHVHEQSIRGTFRWARWPWQVRLMTIPYETITSARVLGAFLELELADPRTLGRSTVRAWVPPSARREMAVLATLFLRRPPGLTRWDRPGYGSGAIPPGAWASE